MEDLDREDVGAKRMTLMKDDATVEEVKCCFNYAAG